VTDEPDRDEEQQVDSLGLTHHLSASRMGMYLRCGMQYAYRYVEGLKEPPGVSMAYGRATHETLAYEHKEQMQRELPSAGEVRDFFDNQVDQHFEEIDLRHPTNQDSRGNPKWTRDDAHDAGGRALAAYTEKVAPAIEPVTVEEPFSIDLPGGVKLVGAIDLRDSSRTVIDHKSGKKSPMGNAAASSDQLTMYALPDLADTARELYEDGMTDADLDDAMGKHGPVVEVALNHLTALKTKSKLTWLPSARTWRSWRTLQQKVVRVAHGIRNENWHPAPEFAWWCSERSCGFWNICPHGANEVHRVMSPLHQIEVAKPKAAKKKAAKKKAAKK